MAVLLISRGTMSGGVIIARCLAEMGHFRCVTREDLIASVNTHGEVASKVTAAIADAAHDYARFSTLRRPFKILMRLSLLEYVRQGNVAYFGYSPHLLLNRVSHFVRVRLIASAELRVRMTMSRLNCTDAEARGYIQKVDEERTRWARFMYGKNLKDPEHFDLCVNMENMSYSTVCSLLLHVVEQKEFQPTPESLSTLENQFLSTRVLGALATDARTADIEVDATAQGGSVVLVGPHLNEPHLSTVLGLATTVPGVTDVRYEPGYAPTFDMSS
jgi:hypothetical protein